MVPEIVGRDADLAAVRAFVEGTDAASAAFVLEGEAGIGKSTLWLAAVEHAHARGFSVLSARPAEAEQGLAHVGLGDLLDGIFHDVAPELSRPRRRALETALLREEAADETIDHRALGVAVHDVLHLLAERGGVLVAIDDAQWLDASTSSALAFALRRVDESSVRVLLARRLETTELEDAFGGWSVERVRVTPLSVGALHRLLQGRVGRAFARQTLLRIHERSGGNPFFALELARALEADVGPFDPFPVPETLDELVRERLSGLPRGTREALALASALGAPSESLLERLGIPADVLEPAIEAHVIERERGTIRFTHPRLASVLYADLGVRRRTVHGRIASVVDDPVARARHLLLATEAPDAAVAAALAAAATVAADRGAAAGAAELAEGAWRLTPASDASERRLRALAAARAHRAAGEWTRARTILGDLLEEPGIDAVRPEALFLLAGLESLDRGIALLEEALREASSRPALQAAIQCRLAWKGLRRRARARTCVSGPCRRGRRRCTAHRGARHDGLLRLGRRRSGDEGAREAGTRHRTRHWRRAPAAESAAAAARDDREERPRRRARIARARTRNLANATTCRRPKHCTASRGSSCGPGSGNGRRTAPSSPTTS